MHVTRTVSPKRFYENVSLADHDGRTAILLDGNKARTPGKAILALPTRGLAEAIADEWRDQGERLDPSAMPLTRLANTAIDGVEPKSAAVIDDILAHARSDLLYYRASGPSGLVGRQAQHWDPIIAWAQDALGAPLHVTEGIVHVAQPDSAISALEMDLKTFDVFGLAAFHVMTGLTGSALLALAVARKRLSAAEAWDAAHVDEDWQISQWGEDGEAKARREGRKRDFEASVSLFELARV